MTSYIADIRDLDKLKEVFEKEQPELVFHLAAQPIVRDSYKMPVYTYETNVMGTVNICECVRLFDCVKSFLNITTDKVYENQETNVAFTEDMPLDGYDPYSNSKSCSELVTHSYKKSFFTDGRVAVSTSRAGNVIGGGDFANDRIIPDCVRAVEKGDTIIVRNPNSTRPYQHVLEPLKIYLMIVEAQYKNHELEGYYNVGPNDCDCRTTGELVTLFCKLWGDGASWKDVSGRMRLTRLTFQGLTQLRLKQFSAGSHAGALKRQSKRLLNGPRYILTAEIFPLLWINKLMNFLNWRTD